jgi:hypothetical protein
MSSIQVEAALLIVARRRKCGERDLPACTPWWAMSRWSVPAWYRCRHRSTAGTPARTTKETRGWWHQIGPADRTTETSLVYFKRISPTRDSSGSLFFRASITAF